MNALSLDHIFDAGIKSISFTEGNRIDIIIANGDGALVSIRFIDVAIFAGELSRSMLILNVSSNGKADRQAIRGIFPGDPESSLFPAYNNVCASDYVSYMIAFSSNDDLKALRD